MDRKHAVLSHGIDSTCASGKNRVNSDFSDLADYVPQKV